MTNQTALMAGMLSLALGTVQAAQLDAASEQQVQNVAEASAPAISSSSEITDSAQANLEKWLLRRLDDPSERELEHEQAGHVYVYDGLTDQDVDQALDTHFDRIEYMMFVGTRKTVPKPTTDHSALNIADGYVETESPGCGN